MKFLKHELKKSYVTSCLSGMAVLKHEPDSMPTSPLPQARVCCFLKSFANQII